MFRTAEISLDRMARNITSIIEDELTRVGIFNRIFYRCKKSSSIEEKMEKKLYDGKEKFLRDVIGVRITFYFADDLDVVYKYIKNKYSKYFVEESIDSKETTVFKPLRLNIVFRLPEPYLKEFKETIHDQRIDSTYELQLRTVLSEGWHEVDHDLRYKNSENWVNQNDLSRMFNGILASLETNDWSIISLFDTLSYRHYKNKNIEAMIRAKFRLRFQGNKVKTEELFNLITKNNLDKELFKFDRELFLYDLANRGLRFPLTIENVLFYLNHFYFKNNSISNITPKELLLHYQNL